MPNVCVLVCVCVCVYTCKPAKTYAYTYTATHTYTHIYTVTHRHTAAGAFNIKLDSFRPRHQGVCVHYNRLPHREPLLDDSAANIEECRARSLDRCYKATLSTTTRVGKCSAGHIKLVVVD